MIRIIGGKHRSRLIETPPSEIVLPTKNMVREALFSILGRKVSNAIVLDLFAGSGALGLEALSRGANKVYFSDHHSEPIKIIGKNVESLKEKDNVEVHLCDYSEMIDYLERNSVLLDIVFVDPPYASRYYEAVITRLQNSKIVQKGTVIAIESKDEIATSLYQGFQSRHYRYGQTHLLIISK
jgi:16S rRNA (guanine(966)-N(2))-methyltransferase RsmD